MKIRSSDKPIVLTALIVMGLVMGFAADSQAQQAEPKAHTMALQSPKATKKAKPRFDVVFAIDATGSMSDEIEVIKKEVWTIANKLASGKPTPDIRFGLVLYKDKGDDFLVKTTPLTRDIDKIHSQLMAVQVGGGGDNPEHVGRGLHAALDMKWGNANATKMIYLVGDAPGQTKYKDGFSLKSAIAKAKTKGIKINAIGCSGISSGGGRAQFAQISGKTNGKFQNLTYHAVVKDKTSGKKRSVVYHDGKTYESDRVLSDKEWKKGADKLVKSKKLRRASSKSKTAAAAAPRKNNLDDVVFDDVKAEAEAKGVAY